MKFFVQKKRDISNYFSTLKFREKIDTEKFTLELKDLKYQETDFLHQQLKEYTSFLEELIKEKGKEWDDQVERAKWKTIVQAHGEMKCKNGHDLQDNLCCIDCHGPIYWADSDEHYVICKGCKNNGLARISGKIICNACGAESLCTVKWIKGYKP